MRTARRKPHSRRQVGDWGVVAFAVHGMWIAFWMELDEPGRVSIEMDADTPDRNITPATWGRARRAFGVPRRILVLDEETAAAVRRAVPARVEVVVEEHPALREVIDNAVCGAFDDAAQA